eukprot:7121720-Ditylum_brightwellii.AAC.2
MPASDIVNRNAQFLIDIEEAVRTSDIKTCIACSVLGTWGANSFANAKVHSPLYSTPKFLYSAGLLTPTASTTPLTEKPGDENGGINISLDPKSTDPFVHTCMPIKNAMDVSRQQKCIMCTAEGRAKATS